MSQRQVILHAEPGGSFRPVWILLAVTAVGTAIDAVVRSPGDALSVVLIGLVVGLCGVGPYVISKRRYGRLEVTPETLRIGKERFALVDLDPAPLHEQVGQGYTGTVGGWFGDPTSPVRVAGGAWGSALGDKYVVLKVRGQAGFIAVATTDPPHLASLLLDQVGRAAAARDTVDNRGSDMT